MGPWNPRPKGKRAASAAKPAATAPAPKPDGILEQADDPSKRPRRQLSRRSSSERVKRALEQHFPEASVQQLESTRVDGKTLREVVKEDMKSKGTGRLGATYWQQVAGRFQFSNSSHDLKVKDKSEVVGEDLIHAIKLAQDGNSQTRSADQLKALMQHRASCNQREFVGLCLAIQKFNGLGVARNTVDAIYIEVLKCVARPHILGMVCIWAASALSHRQRCSSEHFQFQDPKTCWEFGADQTTTGNKHNRQTLFCSESQRAWPKPPTQSVPEFIPSPCVICISSWQQETISEWGFASVHRMCVPTCDM